MLMSKSSFMEAGLGEWDKTEVSATVKQEVSAAVKQTTFLSVTDAIHLAE